MSTIARTRPPRAEDFDTVRVMVVDDHPLMRRGLAELIADAPGMTVCCEAASIAAAVAALAQDEADVAIIDLTLGDENGLDLIEIITKTYPAIRILVLSGHDEQLYAERALKCGALGYITKDADAGAILMAIRRVAAGKPSVSQETADRILTTIGTAQFKDRLAPIDRLSNRERHVLALMGRGMATREIAKQLGRSIKTIDSHFAHIKVKLGVTNSRDLMRIAVTWTETDRV